MKKNFKKVQSHHGLLIEPPPKQKNLYRVVYSIDVDAESSLDAAKKTYEIMTDPDSLPPVLEVIDKRGNISKFDLSRK